jgi:hypothetical protein
MALVRSLALKISDAVVRNASPGSKEWAEGVAREVAFVTGDWAALGWALGSVRVLFDRREAPMGSLAEVSSVAQRFTEAANGAHCLWWPMLQGPQYVWMYFDATSRPQRVGCALVTFCSVTAAIFLLAERRRLKEQMTDEVYLNVLACALFYKAELERRCSRLWIQSAVVVCYCMGMVLAERGGIRAHTVLAGIIGTLCLLAVPLALQARRNNRRRLERLDILLAGTES